MRHCLLWTCQDPAMPGDVICERCAAYFRRGVTCECGRMLVGIWSELETCAPCAADIIGVPKHRISAIHGDEVAIRVAERRMLETPPPKDHPDGSPVALAILSDEPNLWSYFRGILEAGGLRRGKPAPEKDIFARDGSKDYERKPMKIAELRDRRYAR